MRAAGCRVSWLTRRAPRSADAAVTLKNESRGIPRQTLSDEFGHYRFVFAEPGEYEVLFEKADFRPELVKGVRIGVGDVAIVDVELQIGAVLEIVVVEIDTQRIDLERSQQATTLSDESISNLPIDRRDYLTFALLAPGVVGATALADETDLRVKQTPHSGLSFFGSNGRGNSVSVDGGEVNDARGRRAVDDQPGSGRGIPDQPKQLRRGVRRRERRGDQYCLEEGYERRTRQRLWFPSPSIT